MHLKTVIVTTLGLVSALALTSCRTTDGTGVKYGRDGRGMADASISSSKAADRNDAARRKGGVNSGAIATGDMDWKAHALPTGDERTSAVMLRKGFPREVQRGAPFEYVIEVSNLTDHKLEDVVVTDRIPAELKVLGSRPAMQGTKDGVASWVFSELAPGARQSIVVSGSADKLGEIRSCANVSYDTLVCSSISVVEAAIKLTKTAPAETNCCEKIPVKYVVTNTGTGTARDIRIREELPANLQTVDKRSIDLRVDSLKPRQSKEFVVKLEAGKPGTYRGHAVATGAGNLTAKSAETSTIVRKPKLTVSSDAPKQGFLGRDVTQTIKVGNVGDYPARETTVEQNIPAGAKLVSATDGGRQVRNKVVWKLGTIAARADRSISATFKPAGAGVMSTTATASAFCAEPVKASASTELVGIPAILMEVVDLEDPIMVGGEETYEIRVTNQGSAPGTDIKIVCLLESSMSHVSSGGATRATVAGSRVTFSPLESLAPKAKATWRVKVKAAKAADARFKVIMTSAQSQRPVEETESTRFYR